MAQKAFHKALHAIADKLPGGFYAGCILPPFAAYFEQVLLTPLSLGGPPPTRAGLLLLCKCSRLSAYAVGSAVNKIPFGEISPPS